MADFSYDEDNDINDMIESVINNTGHRPHRSLMAGHRSTGAPVRAVTGRCGDRWYPVTVPTGAPVGTVTATGASLCGSPAQETASPVGDDRISHRRRWCIPDLRDM